jgi:hypothetical protein
MATIPATITPAMARRIEIWTTDRLVPYARNARTHSAEQIAQIAASILEFGFTNPILVDSMDGIIAGHGRLLAARKLGLAEVPAVVLDHLSETQRRADILADNKLAMNAGWDEKMLASELRELETDGTDLALIGFSDEELEALLEDGDAPPEDVTDEVPEATARSPQSEAQRQREVDRCRDEIATSESLLLAGNHDVEGLCMALADWSAGLRILEAKAPPPGHGIRRWEAFTSGQSGGKSLVRVACGAERAESTEKGLIYGDRTLGAIASARAGALPGCCEDKVAADSLAKIKLSVWRDFVPSKALILRQNGVEHQVLASESDLQQEVYTWQMREDPFGGVFDEGARARLREFLVDRFEASQPPSKRRFDALADFLDEAQRVIDADQAEWTVSQDAPLDDEDVPYRLNPLLALKLHLEWLKNTFSARPGVSVSIR